MHVTRSPYLSEISTNPANSKDFATSSTCGKELVHRLIEYYLTGNVFMIHHR